MIRITILLISLILALLACTTRVLVEGAVPTPLVNKIPARVGVYYDEGLKNFVHTETLRQGDTWQINLGEQNLTFFRHLMNAMFDQVVELSQPKLLPNQHSLDGVVISSIEKYGFLTPDTSGLNFFSVSIHYRITMLDANNQKVADWMLVGYGKSEGGALASGKALGEATMLAIRDGGARIAIGLPQQVAIKTWLSAVEQNHKTQDGQKHEKINNE